MKKISLLLLAAILVACGGKSQAPVDLTNGPDKENLARARAAYAAAVDAARPRTKIAGATFEEFPADASFTKSDHKGSPIYKSGSAEVQFLSPDASSAAVSGKYGSGGTEASFMVMLEKKSGAWALMTGDPEMDVTLTEK